jgi:hypothetical protein
MRRRAVGFLRNVIRKQGLKESYAQPAGGAMVTVEGGRDCSDFDRDSGGVAFFDDEFVGAGDSDA